MIELLLAILGGVMVFATIIAIMAIIVLGTPDDDDELHWRPSRAQRRAWKRDRKNRLDISRANRRRS